MVTKTAIFKIDEFGYPRFTNSGFDTPEKTARELTERNRESDGATYEAMTYGEYKKRQDPDSMGERELTIRLGGNWPPVRQPQPVIVITGKHARRTRDQARKFATESGCRVVSDISPNVTHIWAGERPGASKIRKASDLKIPVIAKISEALTLS